MVKLLLILFSVVTLVRAEEPKRFNGSFSTSVESDFKQLDDSEKILALTSAIRLSYMFPKLFTVSSGIFFDKDLVGERKENVNDTYISLSRKVGEINENLPITGKTTIFLPISKSSRERTFLNTGYKLSGILGVKVPTIEALSGSVALNFTQNFHRSEVTMGGQSNKQFLFSAGGSVGYEFLKHFEASMNLEYIKGITYQGNIVDTYSTGQQISYNASEKFNLGVGHSLGGNIYKANGYESNISAFDLNESTVYMFVTMEIF
jgi:hypothetical protein